MNREDNKREMEQLERDIAERQKQIDRERALQWREERQQAEPCAHLYDRTFEMSRRQDVVTRSAPAPQPQPSGHGFTPREMALLEAVMHATGKVLAEERKKARDHLQRVEQELRHALEHKIDNRKFDKTVSEFRSELLTERLSSEREMRAMEQRYYRDRDRGMGSGSGGGVLDMKEIN